MSQQEKFEHANEIIKSHVLYSMGAGLVPIFALDIIAVTGIQMDMLRQLSSLYEIPYSKNSGKSFVSALTGSSLARIGASAVKAIPGIGTIFGGISMAAMSGASTYAVGHVFLSHFSSGGDFSNFDPFEAKGQYKYEMEKGKEMAPDNGELLFAEINYYISQNAFDKLEEKLKQAIEKEPNNPSVRTALGNVYMNLYEDDFATNGDTENGKKYFDSAIDYFNQAIEIEPKSFDAQYSIGSMYFNKAVEIYKKMGGLGMSKEDQKKYEAYKEEADKLMATSLPFFKKAESINPNDMNTLIALSEVFARTNDFEKSKAFKDRLGVVKEGGSHDNSYFNE